MKFLFLGGDKRYRFMMDDLASEHEVSCVGFSSLKDNICVINLDEVDFSEFDVVILPISGIGDQLEIKTEIREDVFE